MSLTTRISEKSEVNINDFSGNFTFGYYTNRGKKTKAAFKRICYRKIYGFDKFGLLDENAKKKVQEEIDVMQKLTRLNQSHVVKLFEAIPGESSYWLVLEHCNYGNLEDYANETAHDEINKLTLIRKCAECVRFLHTIVPVIHNDIRPTKFLVQNAKGQTRVKLASFPGLLPTDTTFLAPEVICGTSRGSMESDVFSLGLVFLALLQHSAGKMIVCTGLNKADKSFANAMLEFEQPDMFMQCLLKSNLQNERLMVIIEHMLKFEPKERVNISSVCDEIVKLMTPHKTDISVPDDTSSHNKNTSGHDKSLPSLTDDISGEKAVKKFETRLKRLICHCDHSNGNCTSEICLFFSNGLTMYKIPLHFTYCNDVTMIKKCTIGPVSDSAHSKTILLLGATGCGKTTTINAIANYIFGVQLEDGYRFKLTDSSSGENTNVTESQTKWITTYTIRAGEYSCLDYSLTLVDMPGFEDTRGIQYDNQLISNIQQLFSGTDNGGISSVDAICILAKAGDCRLTHNQRYIFDCIMSLFSESVRENIIVMSTHSDGQKPLVVEALNKAGVTFTKYFKMNNSHLYIDREDQYAKPYWEMASEGYNQFFAYLTKRRSTDVILCQNVITIRQNIDASLDILNDNFPLGQSTCKDIETLEKELRNERQKVKENKDYTRTEIVYTKEKVKTKENEYETYCNKCEQACHENCPNTGENIKECVAFDDGGKCIACTNKCPISDHVSNEFYLKEIPKEQQIYIPEKKTKFIKAATRFPKIERALQIERKKFSLLESEMSKVISDIQSELYNLNEVALVKEHSFINKIQYLEFLVESKSVQMDDETKSTQLLLKDLRNKQELLQKVIEKKNIFGDI